MAIGLSLNTIGLQALTRKLVRHSNKIKNQRRSLFARLSVLGFKDIQEHFKNEEGPSGGGSLAGIGMAAISGRSTVRWRALSPVTIARRRKGGKGAKILQDTGNLRNSLMANVGKKVIRADSVILSVGGSNKSSVDDYASKHNFGFGVPKREFMYISKDGNAKIVKQVIKFIKWV